ncbi:MAG: hypothetical protein WC314_25220 [Vulcanimicrobiota bacterium]
MTQPETTSYAEYADFLLDFHGITRQDILEFIAALETLRDADS